MAEMTGETPEIEVRVVQYPFPEGNPPWARTAPQDWTPRQRNAAEKYWEENVCGKFDVDLTTYGYLAAGREPPSDADLKAIAAQRQRDRRARLKAEAVSPFAEAAAPANSAKGGRKSRLTEAERKARDSERQRARRQALKIGTEGKAAEASRTPTVAATAPMSPIAATAGGVHTVELTVDAEAYEVLRSVAMVRSFGGPEALIPNVVAEIVRGALPSLREELRKLRDALSVATVKIG